MAQHTPHNYLRTHRRKSGLTQRELAYLLGYRAQGQVSRHERTKDVPSFLVAIGYEIVFRVPVAELFPGAYAHVGRLIEARVAEMESILHGKGAKGRDANAIAQKLEWIHERRNPIEV